jgi:acetyltransferase
MVGEAQRAHRDSLSESESKELLALYGIGSGAGEGTDGYSLRIGSRVDPEFGPVLWLGAGGRFSELLSAAVVGLPPLNATLARRMLERSPLYDGLEKLARRNAVDLSAIDATLVRLSQVIVEQPAIREVSINPLVVSAGGSFAGNARIALYGAQGGTAEAPKSVFRPFPVQYVSAWATRHGQALTIRPIRAEDEPLMVEFHGQLSDNAVYSRYFQVVKLERRTTHDALIRECYIDYDREMVLVAERRREGPAERQILAIASLTKLPRKNHGEVAVLVRDDCQRHGIGSELVRRLVDVARDEGLDRVFATTMPNNVGMSAVFKRLGFTLSIGADEVRAEFDLRK